MTGGDPTGDAEFQALLDKIMRERRFGCGHYKEKCLRRRIAVRMRARAVHTYADYARILDADAPEWDRLLDALTINVTKLFRNPETFAALERLVLPALWQRPAIRVWSAGCASGEEPYSLALLLHRYAERRQDPGMLGRVSILGTDIDRASLDHAAKASYGASALTDLPEEIARRYFPDGPPAIVPPEVRALVRFARRDLLQDALPDGAWDLITCRNVIIYFGRETQEMLFERFLQALAPGGYLVLGKVETLLGPARSQLVAVDSRERIFQRP